MQLVSLARNQLFCKVKYLEITVSLTDGYFKDKMLKHHCSRHLENVSRILLIIGLSFIKRPIFFSHLNLKLVQIGWKAHPPGKFQCWSCNVNFSRHIFMHDWTHFMHHWNPWSNWWYLKVGQKKPSPLRGQTRTGHFLIFPATLDQVAKIRPHKPPQVIWQDQSDTIQMEGLSAPDFYL